MKKYFILGSLSATILIFANCSNTKKIATLPAPATTFETNMQTLIVANCSPCHIPGNGGRMRPYDNYTNVKTDIDEILRRIQLNPGEKGFMPFKKTAKLSDSTIAVFQQWKTDGLLEK